MPTKFRTPVAFAEAAVPARFVQPKFGPSRRRLVLVGGPVQADLLLRSGGQGSTDEQRVAGSTRRSRRGAKARCSPAGARGLRRADRAPRGARRCAARAAAFGATDVRYGRWPAPSTSTPKWAGAAETPESGPGGPTRRPRHAQKAA